MFTGFFIGIIAAFVWAVTNLVDKYLVDKYASEGNIGGVLLLSCFFPLSLLLVSAFVAPEHIMNVSVSELGILMLSGALMVMWIYFYLKALSVEDSSVVMTLLVLAPFFSLIFAQQILHELPTPYQLVAGIFLVAGAITVVYEPRTHHFKWKLFGYALAASATTGLMTSLFKFAAVDVGVWESLFWRSSGMILIGCLLFSFVKSFRHDFYYFMKDHFGQAAGLNLGNESLTLIGDTLFSFAMVLAPLALLQTTEAYQPIFIFIMVIALNKLGYTAVTENIDQRVLIQKGSGFALVLTGTILLSVVG